MEGAALMLNSLGKWIQLLLASVGAALVLSLVICGGFFTLREVNSQIDERISYFQDQREITNSNRHQLKQLSQQKKNLQQQLNLLSGLRSGASAEQMFVMIDRALPVHPF